MSASIHVASHEIADLQKVIEQGILAIRQWPKQGTEINAGWEPDKIEEIGKRIMQELADDSSSGEGYVKIP